MNDLTTTYADFDNDSTFAFAVMANIAIVGDNIQESLMRMYTTPVNDLINPQIVAASLAYFHGSKVLSVMCDCSDAADECLVNTLESNPWNERGREDALIGSPMYNRAVTDVTALRCALY